jgi:hypothetical protein
MLERNVVAVSVSLSIPTFKTRYPLILSLSGARFDDARDDFDARVLQYSAQKHIAVETVCSPVALIQTVGGAEKKIPCCMVTQWPLEVRFACLSSV